jgi:hypothetical protein
MAHLTLAGVSDDGKRLLLVSDSGAEFTLDVDTRLRAALRGEHIRFGQLEIKMDSALRPRDIQARIRSGESPEAVAEAAQTSVDKIMAFAAPVLAEREHVAQRAQRSSVRRRSGDAGGARTLGDAVAVHLRSLDIDPGTVEWDSWRREDGRWVVTGSFDSGRRSGAGRFAYDAPGNYVTLENDDARWLVGEAVETAAERPEPRDDLRRARQRRLSSVPEDELPLGDDAIELVTGGAEATPADDISDDRADDRADDHAASEGVKDRDELGAEQPLEAFLDEEPPTGEAAAVDAEVREEAEDAAALDEPEPEEPPARRPVKKSRGRASVPSWDEIMFGGGKQD